MNWKEIKKKYSKAHKKFGIWADKDGQYCDVDLEYLWINPSVLCETLNHIYYNDRDLYDFFDEQGVYITVTSGIISLETFERKFRWEISINQEVGTSNAEPCIFKSRKEAEEQAFLKAFEILENK